MKRLTLLTLLVLMPFLTGQMAIGRRAYRPVVALLTCQQEQSDDFATNNYGSTWVGGLSVDQTNCPWTVDSGNNNLLRLDSDSNTLCDNRRFSIGHSTAVTDLSQYGCVNIIAFSGTAQIGITSRADTQAATNDMYFGYTAEATSSVYWRSADNANDIGTCVVSTAINASTDDQLCVLVTGTGTATEMSFWGRDGGSDLTGTPADWGPPDCCINDAGTVGGLGITCSDATQALTGANITDDGLYTGINTRFPNVGTSSYNESDNYLGGSCE
jgi:hypothetical protein